MLIFYILLQNYNLFLYRIFFLRKHSRNPVGYPENVGYATRRNYLLGHPIGYRISDIRYFYDPVHP